MSSAATLAEPEFELWGKETPRIFTPPLVELHDTIIGPLGNVVADRTTEGYRCIAFAEDVLGVRLFPWQKWFLIHALELKANMRFRFRTLLLLVGRQNGKSVLSIVLSLFFIYVLQKNLVLGTAQDLDVAEEIWGAAVEIAEGVEVLAERIRRVDYSTGQKQLRLKNGCRYKVKAANRRAGRSLSAELVMLDELREHQKWDAWGAITKTTMAKADALILCLSNAGDATSVVLRHLREMAHRKLGDPDGLFTTDEALPDAVPEEINQRSDPDAVAIFEWSAPPNADRWDTDAWAQANPSVGWNPEFTVRNIEAAASSDPEWIFRTEVLCQWSDGLLVGIFPSGAWEATSDPDSVPLPRSKVVVGVDVSYDRTITRMVSATWRDDGCVHLEVIAQRAGTDWVRPWITDPAHPQRISYEYVGQTNGAPVSSLMADLAAAVDERDRPLGIKVIDWKGDELARAHGRFFDAVTAKTLDPRTGERTLACPTVYHRPTATLDRAAAAAKSRSMGDGWVVDRKGSAIDVSSLVAAIGAFWRLTYPSEPVRRSAYEDHGLEVA